MKVALIIAASLAFAFVLGTILWTVGQGAARRARTRADGIVARDGLTASPRTATVNLLGSTSLQRSQIRGVGVLGITESTLEFRLGYGSTAISIPLAAIHDVSVGKTFSMSGRAKKMLHPWILTIHWNDGISEQKAGFSTRQADELIGWFTR